MEQISVHSHCLILLGGYFLAWLTRVCLVLCRDCEGTESCTQRYWQNALDRTLQACG
ncbi:hypothetical protein BaRGS_00007106, partial [Batillaria attramentaria]